MFRVDWVHAAQKTGECSPPGGNINMRIMYIMLNNVNRRFILKADFCYQRFAGLPGLPVCLWWYEHGTNNTPRRSPLDCHLARYASCPCPAASGFSSPPRGTRRSGCESPARLANHSASGPGTARRSRARRFRSRFAVCPRDVAALLPAHFDRRSGRSDIRLAA